MKPTIQTHVKDNLPEFRKKLAGLLGAKVLVGIPEDKAARKGEPINNAQLMYIHTNGSEVRNIPKRPVIEPSIQHNREQLTRTLEQAADAHLGGDTARANQLLKVAGTQGANGAKRWFTDPNNGWPRNKSATIKRKISKLRGVAYKDALKILNDAGETGDVSAIDTPLIDQGELRRAITHVEQPIE